VREGVANELADGTGPGMEEKPEPFEVVVNSISFLCYSI